MLHYLLNMKLWAAFYKGFVKYFDSEAKFSSKIVQIVGFLSQFLTISLTGQMGFGW